MGRTAISREVGENFPKDTCEFEAVAGEAGSDGHAVAIGMQADDEVVVIGHRVEARGMGRATCAELREMRSRDHLDTGLLGGVDAAIDGEWIHFLLPAGVLGEFQAAAIQLWEAIKKSIGPIEREAGEGVGREE